ncbi:MAG TPA: exodeoxyribonuclease V subunit gamma [Acidimicrobiia bacterium]
MAIQIHVAPHPDALVSLLCDQLALPPDDPFGPDLVAVPSRGIERWLTQRIASGLAERGMGDGICANVGFPSPSDLVRRAMMAVPELAASVAVWEGPALTAHLLDAIDHHLTEPWLGLLARYLANGTNGAGPNRLAAAQKIGRLFSRYARRRPGMVGAWRAGEDRGPDGGPLPDDHLWQPRLWRALRDRLGVPALPEILAAALDPLRHGRVEVDMPHRIGVYGLTSADPLDLEVLTALAARHEVHLYVLHPSPALWDAVAAAEAGALPSRPYDATLDLAHHPLMKAWGRDSRELQSVLATSGLTATPIEREANPTQTLLGRIQDDIRRNAVPALDADLASAVEGGDDRSIQVHVCHGTRRQVEVARDAVLHLLSARPDLEPRDIVIMTPDLATFAPLLEAAFPRENAGGLPDLRLRIADRAPAVNNPLVGFTAALMKAAGSRMEADVVRDLVRRPVVQARFGFDADTAGDIVTLIDDAHVSWGIDEEHRRQWGVGSTTERTWRRGLARALTGVFYADSRERTVGDISPLDGVEGQEAIPAGLLAAILDRLTAIRDLMGTQRPLSEWADVIAGSVRMLAAPAWGEEWQLDQLERLLAETFPPPEPGRVDPVVTLAEASGAIAPWTEDRPSPLHFRTGDITVCTLVPMRSVPYRVVALLGMDEARFPRRGRLDGDDLLADHELVGDRDAGSMDRQLLLDAVMAAGEHLIVTYSGRDEFTNGAIPPAVPVAELTDTLAEMVGPGAKERLITRHPLQSFSEANFRDGALGIPGPWSFDPVQHQGAVAIQQRPLGEARSVPVSWPDPPDDDAIRLVDLHEFLANPARRFVKTRLGFTVPDRGGIPDDTLPADLDPLGKWGVTDRILSGLVAGRYPADLVARERGSDAVPPGDLGDDDLEQAVEAATTLWEAAQELGYQPSRHQTYTGVVAAREETVEGTVLADLEGAHLLTVTPSRLRGRQRLRAFVEMVFLTALRPEVAWRAVMLGKRETGGSFLAVTVGPIKDDSEGRREKAVALLSELVDLYREGQRRPLPLPCETAYTWQRNGGAGDERARGRAKGKFEGDFGEANDAALMLIEPDLTTFAALETTDFVDYCRRLWLPILAMSSEKNL